MFCHLIPVWVAFYLTLLPACLKCDRCEARFVCTIQCQWWQRLWCASCSQVWHWSTFACAPAENHTPSFSPPWKNCLPCLQACSRRSFKAWHPHLKLVSPVTCQKYIQQMVGGCQMRETSALPRLNKCTVNKHELEQIEDAKRERNTLLEPWSVFIFVFVFILYLYLYLYLCLSK